MYQPPVSFTLRFDFRNPDFAGTTMADRYAAALDMAERSAAAASGRPRHAARIADGLIPNVPEVWQFERDVLPEFS